MKKHLLIYSFILLLPVSLTAQINIGNNLENISYERPVEYEIAGITVEGIQNLDKNAIITLSGLNVGKKIMVPGEDLSKAITKLWDQNLFADIRIDASKVMGSNVFLEIQLEELPKLSKFGFKGASKSEADKIRDKIELTRGKIVTENLINNTKHVVLEYYKDKGYLNTIVEISQAIDTTSLSSIILDIDINKGEKVKINSITFKGINEFSEKKLKRTLKETKEKKFFRIFKTSKFLDEAFKTDLEQIINLYNEKGYRDAQIVLENVDDISSNLIDINITIEEGIKYHFRNIDWLGNTKHNSQFRIP